jgi:tripartite-type tricarboxylate transporter receptor subunit TctC
MTPIRPVLLAALLLSSSAALAQHPKPVLVIFEPYGAQSVTDEVSRLLQPALEAGLGGTLAIHHRAGTAGGAAMTALRDAPADGHTLVVLALSTRALHEALHPEDTPKLDELTPIAKLTRGISMALVVPLTSPIHDWHDLQAAAKAHPLTVADVGRDAGMVIELRWLEHALGRPVHNRLRGTRHEILVALSQGQADVGLLATATLEPPPGTPPLTVRAIVTFGPERYPGLPDVPTFAEASGDKMATHTGIIAVCGPPGLPPATAKRLSELFLSAGSNPQVRSAAGAVNFPLEVEGPDAVRDALRETERVTQFYVKTHHFPVERTAK